MESGFWSFLGKGVKHKWMEGQWKPKALIIRDPSTGKMKGRRVDMCDEDHADRRVPGTKEGPPPYTHIRRLHGVFGSLLPTNRWFPREFGKTGKILTPFVVCGPVAKMQNRHVRYLTLQQLPQDFSHTQGIHFHLSWGVGSWKDFIRSLLPSIIKSHLFSHANHFYVTQFAKKSSWLNWWQASELTLLLHPWELRRIFTLWKLENPVQVKSEMSWWDSLGA